MNKSDHIAEIAITGRPPGVRVRVRNRERAFSLDGLRPERLHELRSALPDSLHGFRQAVGHRDLTLDGTFARDALERLDRFAVGLAGKLLGGPVSDQYDVEELEDAIAQMLYPALKTSAHEMPVIELTAEDGAAEDAAWLLPIEFLRIAAPKRTKPKASDVLERVLGLHAVVVRRACATHGNNILGPGPIPVIALLQDRANDSGDLQGPDQQATFFQRHPDCFALHRWPDRKTFPNNMLYERGTNPTYKEHDVARSLTSHVIDCCASDLSWHRLNLTALEPRQYRGVILHVACHYYTAKSPSWDQPPPFLSFGPKTHVGTEALWSAFMQELMTRKQGPAGGNIFERFGRAIVFLNACETAVSAAHGVSLLQYLFRLGFRQIIASETLVPDTITSAFARQLYLALLRRMPLGSAFLQARIELLERHRNPGGLLYTLYGNPSLTLVP